MWVPWALWRAYGNLQVLRDQFDSMIAHVRRVESLLSPTGLWDTGFQFGDWLDPTAPPDQPAAQQGRQRRRRDRLPLSRRTTSWRTLQRLLRRSEDERHFADLAERTSDARSTSTTSHDDGTIRSDAQTVYALALVFGLLDEDTGQLAGSASRNSSPRAATTSRPALPARRTFIDALSATGHSRRGRTGCCCSASVRRGSIPVTMGATTIWERWDSMLPDGTINPGEMTSFNHYALGAVADWMHRCIGGIAPLEPGYSKVLIAPQPGGDIHWARSSLETSHGTISVSWSRKDDDPIELDVVVPDGVTALVRLPDTSTRRSSAVASTS